MSYDDIFDKSEARILIEDKIHRRKKIDLLDIRDKIIELEKQIISLERENVGLCQEITDLRDNLDDD